MKPDCQNITAEDQQTLSDMAEIFKHPIGLLVHVGEHVFLDNIAIEGELIHAVHAYDEKNYVAAGEFIGEAMAIVFWGKNPVMVSNEFDERKILAIIDGVFVGILGTEDLQSVEQCIEDAPPIIHTLIKAFKDYKAGKTAKASILAGQALHQFTSTMKPDCMNITDEDLATIHEMVDAFKHPLSEVAHVGEHILVNGIAIESDLVHMVHAYDMGNFKKSGEFLGSAISLVFWGQISIAIEGEDAVTDANLAWEITQVVDGLIIGVFKQEGVESVEMCLDNVSNLVPYMEKAIADFKDPTTFNIGDGIYNLGLFIQEIAISMDDCASLSEEDIETMRQMGEVFTHPLHEIVAIGEHIIINGIYVQYEILAAVHLWDVGRFQAAGERLGEGLALILWGKQLKEIEMYSNGVEDGLTAEIIEIIDGIIVGVFQTEGIPTISGCIDDINSVAVFIDEAVHQFKLGGYHNVVQGVYYIGEAVSQIGLSVEDCSSLTPDQVEIMKQMGEVFKHPGSLVVDAGKHIAVNGVEIFVDIKNAIQEWDSEMYFEFGVSVGDAFALVMWGEPHVELLQE